jgi:hypothetical protein
VQYREDDRLGVGKRSRVELAPEYRERYLHEILDQADLSLLIDELPVEGSAALLCVERDPQACHRSLVAERLAREHDVTVVDLSPRRPDPEVSNAADVARSSHMRSRWTTPGCDQASDQGNAMSSERPSKPALDDDNSEPPRGDKGDRGLGTEAGVAQAGDQHALGVMPERRGDVKYPDVENPDDLRPHIAPQEGHIEEDPDTVRDASPGARD